MKMKSLLYLICMCSSFAYAQSAAWQVASKEEIAAAYQKSCAWFITTPSYSFKLKYTSYKDHVSKEQIESSEGYYKRVSNNYVTEAVGLKTVQNDNLKTVIDTADRIITVMTPGNLKPNIAGAEELEALLANARSLKKAKLAKGIKYHIDFSKNDQYDAYEFTISDQNFIEGLTYYYSEQVEKVYSETSPAKSTEIKMKPRLEINFFNYQVPAKYNEAEFSDQSIIARDKGKVSLTGAYKDYRLMDYRLQTKK